MIKNHFLFNFSASYSGGGFKRLYAYAEWFNRNGGAFFIIHPNCSALVEAFPNNAYMIPSPSKFQRLWNDCGYLDDIQQEIGRPDLYYAYGIPVYRPVGRVNWFHLSNVLPLGSRGIPLPFQDRMKLAFLGQRIERHFKHANIISAESQFALDLVDPSHTAKRVVSVNGSDDEIRFDSSEVLKKEPIAVVVGTYQYKALDDSYRVFEMLSENNPDLRLMIIGDEKKIPSWLLAKNRVDATGCLHRDKVIQHLRLSEYYISTTHIENSYNAASEGIFFADHSYISDIGPHQELLLNIPYHRIAVPKVDRAMLHVERKNISPVNLKTWNDVIVDMLNHINE